MVDYCRRPVVHEAFFRKYASKKFLKGKILRCTVNETLLTTASIYPDPRMGQEMAPFVL